MSITEIRICSRQFRTRNVCSNNFSYLFGGALVTEIQTADNTVEHFIHCFKNTLILR
jgi:hypothetical protein